MIRIKKYKEGRSLFQGYAMLTLLALVFSMFAARFIFNADKKLKLFNIEKKLQLEQEVKDKNKTSGSEYPSWDVR